MVRTQIIFCGQECLLICDGQCDMAWGINWVGEKSFPAPIDPETYEGEDAKPIDKKHNKWCARECERSSLREIYLKAI